jgi:hypothetical protein
MYRRGKKKKQRLVFFLRIANPLATRDRHCFRLKTIRTRLHDPAATRQNKMTVPKGKVINLHFVENASDSERGKKAYNYFLGPGKRSCKFRGNP